jgi:hypothetical protein
MTSLLLSTLKRLQQIVDGIFTIVRSTPAFFAPSPNSLRTISPSGDLSFSTHKNAHRLLLSKQPARAVHKSIRTFFCANIAKFRTDGRGNRRPRSLTRKTPGAYIIPDAKKIKEKSVAAASSSKEQRTGARLISRIENLSLSHREIK